MAAVALGATWSEELAGNTATSAGWTRAELARVKAVAARVAVAVVEVEWAEALVSASLVSVAEAAVAMAMEVKAEVASTVAACEPKSLEASQGWLVVEGPCRR